MRHKKISESPNKEHSGVWGARSWFERQAQSTKNSPASYFSHSINGYQRFRHDFLARYLGTYLYQKEVKCVLDIGCAQGDFLSKVVGKTNAEKAIGLDFIMKVVQDGRKKYPNFNFIVSELPEIPAEDGKIDLVIASEVLYYLSESDRKIAIDNIYRVLDPEGILFFTSALGGNYFTQQSSLNLIEQSFHCIKIDYLHSKLYNKLLEIPFNIVRFSDMILNDEVPGNKSFYRIYSNLKLIFNNNIGKLILRSMSYPFSKMIANVHIPSICERIASFLGQSYQSNIIILAKPKINLSEESYCDCNTNN